MATDRAKRIAAVRRRIVPVSQAQPYTKIMIYGRSGKGKTRVAATIGKVCKTLLIDINEQGTLSIRDFPGVDVLSVDKWEDIVYAYWMLRTSSEYGAVVLDTVTQMQHVCMKRVLREEADRDPHKDPNMPSRREWGKLSELMRPQLLNFRNLPMHVIFVAQERIQREENDGDEDAAAIEHVPDLSPGSRGTAMASVSVLGRVYQKEIVVRDPTTKKEQRKWETRMLVGPHEEYATKDRTGSLGRIVRQPTVPKILDAVQNKTKTKE